MISGKRLRLYLALYLRLSCSFWSFFWLNFELVVGHWHWPSLVQVCLCPCCCVSSLAAMISEVFLRQPIWPFRKGQMEAGFWVLAWRHSKPFGGLSFLKPSRWPLPNMTTAYLEPHARCRLAYTIDFIDTAGVRQQLTSCNLGNYSSNIQLSVIYRIASDLLSLNSFEKRPSVLRKVAYGFAYIKISSHLGWSPVTLLIMVVSILLSFFPFFWHSVRFIRSKVFVLSVIYLAFIRATPSDSLDSSL